MIDIEDIVKNFVDDYCRAVWTELQGKGVDGVGVSGSYARGDWSRGRPDINFAVFVENVTPDLLIKIGNIASRLNDTYSKYANLRPELHPHRFVAPWGRDSSKRDVFFKIGVYDESDQNEYHPFGLPSFYAEANQQSLKMWHGRDYLKEIQFHAENKMVLEVVAHAFEDWKPQIEICPLSYNLEEDIDLFFNEAMIWGKLIIQQYAWIQGLKNKLNYKKKDHREEIFDKIHDKRQLRGFVDVPEKQRVMVNLVLDARLNYDSWKNDKEKAYEVYRASFALIELFGEETAKLQ